MQNLIVLGLLPGTGIQISFLFWLGGVLTAFFCIAVWLLRRVHLIQNWIVATTLFIITHRRLQI